MSTRLSASIGGLLAFLLPVLVVPNSLTGYRLAAIVVLAAVALPLLVTSLVHHRDVAAAAAAGFVVWAGLSTLTSGNVTMSLWGQYDWFTGFVFVVALTGAWTIGRRAGDRIRYIENGLLAAAALNALLSILQLLLDLSRFDLQLYAGRSTGLMGNPVYLAILVAGGFWIAATRMARPRLSAALLCALLAAGVQASGSRAAVALLALSIVFVPLPFRLRGLAAAAAVVGLAVASAAGTVHHSQTGSSRIAQNIGSQAGYRARGDMWRVSRHAIARAPVLGAGPGRYQAATERDRTLTYVKDEAAAAIYADAHNLVVEYAVTTGVPGVLLLGLWLYLALRRARLRSALGGFAVLVLLFHLVEPQSLQATPLAFLALGAAAAPDWLTDEDHAYGWAHAGAAGAGAIGAGVLVVGFWFLNQARLDFRVSDARTAARLLPGWPQPTDQLARAYLFRGRTARREADLQSAVAVRRHEVRLDPDDPEVYVNLATGLAIVGDDGGVETALHQLLAVDPYSVLALNELASRDLRRGDRSGALSKLRRSLAVKPSQPEVETTVQRLQSP